MAAKAPRERSRQRLATNGPRSLMRTVTDLPFDVFVTRTFVLKGSVLCAAVMPSGRKRSPLAVREPEPY